MMPWKWEIAIYLWVAGIAGGAYFAAFLMDRFSGGKHKSLLRVAPVLGVPLVLVGVLLLVLDLGEPLRAWHLFVRFRLLSPMSMGSWILLVWAIIGVVLIALWWAENLQAQGTDAAIVRLVRPILPAQHVLAWIAFVLSALLIAYTGVLLGTSNQPLWRNLLLPALFVASAVSTGTALVLLAARTGLVRLVDRLFAGPGEPTPEETVHTMGNASAIVGIVEVVVLVGFLIWVGLFSTTAAAGAVGTLISGALALPFWIGVVLVGLLIPLILEFASVRAKKEVVVGSILASTSLVILGGLVLRVVVVFGGQM